MSIEEQNNQNEAEEKEHVHGSNCNHDHHSKVETFIRQEPKIGRNDPCLCNSGKKYKKCCGK